MIEQSTDETIPVFSPHMKDIEIGKKYRVTHPQGWGYAEVTLVNIRNSGDVWNRLIKRYQVETEFQLQTVGFVTYKRRLD